MAKRSFWLSAVAGNPRAVIYARTAQHRSAMADFHEAALHYAQQFYPQLGDCQLTKGLKGMLKLGESLPDELLHAHPELSSRHNVNIDQFNLGRDQKGGEAMALLRVDEDIEEDLLRELENLPNINFVCKIRL